MQEYLQKEKLLQVHYGRDVASIMMKFVEHPQRKLMKNVSVHLNNALEYVKQQLDEGKEMLDKTDLYSLINFKTEEFLRFDETWADEFKEYRRLIQLLDDEGDDYNNWASYAGAQEDSEEYDITEIRNLQKMINQKRKDHCEGYYLHRGLNRTTINAHHLDPDTSDDEED